MPASDAQIRANRANSAKSTGPKTPEGKNVSRENALTHGLTATTVIPERVAVEVERRSAAFVKELNPSGEVGQVLARHAARMSVRLEQCDVHQSAMLIEHVRQTLGEFVTPEGLTEAEARQLRTAVERLALFDASKQASLARKYEAAAERGFFRALKEVRLHEKQVNAAQAKRFEEDLASILPGDLTDEDFDRLYPESAVPRPREPILPGGSVDFSTLRRRIDVPITIGRRS